MSASDVGQTMSAPLPAVKPYTAFSGRLFKFRPSPISAIFTGMNQKKSVITKAKGASGAAGKPSKRAEPVPYSHTVREIVEQVIIALVLAFLFRTFEAEAFV